MSSYIKLSTLEYPRHEGDIRIEHPEITQDQTGDTFPCPDTYALVVETSQPEVTDSQTVLEMQPQQIDGVWQRVWLVHNMTAEEIAARDNVRKILMEQLQNSV